MLQQNKYFKLRFIIFLSWPLSVFCQFVTFFSVAPQLCGIILRYSNPEEKNITQSLVLHINRNAKYAWLIIVKQLHLELPERN